MAYTTHSGATSHPTVLDINHPGTAGMTTHPSSVTNHPGSQSTGFLEKDSVSGFLQKDNVGGFLLKGV